MANPSFLTELLHNLGQAISSLTGWQQATHAEVQATRQAVERGSGGRPFDVISGLPAGSGNARSLTAMLSGARTPPAMPRVSTTPGGMGTSTAGGGGGPEEPNVPTDNMARNLGRMVGGIFRRLTGGGGATAAGSGAVGAAGQTGMTGGLLVRGGAAAMGVGAGVGTPLTIGLALYGVSKALQGFGERVTEQSRYLRSYSGATNVAFASLDRQKEILNQQYAGGTTASLQKATKAEEEARQSWQPWNVMMGNVKNWLAEKAMKAAGAIGGGFSALTESKGFEKAAEQAHERQKAPTQREADRRAGLTTFGRLFENMIVPGNVGTKGGIGNQLAVPGGMPGFGNLARQMQTGMMGLNPPHAGHVAGAAWDPGKLAAADVAAHPILPNMMGPAKQTSRERVDARNEARLAARLARRGISRENWEKHIEARKAIDEHNAEKKREEREEARFNAREHAVNVRRGRPEEVEARADAEKNIPHLMAPGDPHWALQ